MVNFNDTFVVYVMNIQQMSDIFLKMVNYVLVPHLQSWTKYGEDYI